VPARPTPTLAQLVAFALPCLALPLADPVMSLIDTLCIGQCATTLELAAMGPASLLFGAVSTLFGAFSATTISRISRLVSRGAGEGLRVEVLRVKGACQHAPSNMHIISEPWNPTLAASQEAGQRRSVYSGRRCGQQRCWGCSLLRCSSPSASRWWRRWEW